MSTISPILPKVTSLNLGTIPDIMIRYKVYDEQHPRAGLNIQHVMYEQLARAGRKTARSCLKPV